MASRSPATTPIANLYPYNPSHVLPIIFAALVGMSLLLHIYQNFLFRFWRINFFMVWAGTVFTTGWILRCVSTYYPSNTSLYISQYVLIYAGPPIYSAVEYNILGRLVHYLPMHAPVHPRRVVILFIYLGSAVEGLTAAGASLLGTARTDIAILLTGGKLISVALVLQGVVECLFIMMIALIHHRCARSKMLPRNVFKLFVMLYGTSTLILLRCVFRAIQAFNTMTVTSCGAVCRVVVYQEWYIYVFEAAPMVLYTYWINIVNPGTLLPRDRHRYLDIDGKTERMGPGWIDTRSGWKTFVDPLDIVGNFRGHPSHEQFWLQPAKWPALLEDSFAEGTGTNTRRSARIGSRKHNAATL